MLHSEDTWYGTTILSVRSGGQVVIAGDGQVTLGSTVIKSQARKVRRLSDGKLSLDLQALQPMLLPYSNY